MASTLACHSWITLCRCIDLALLNRARQSRTLPTWLETQGTPTATPITERAFEPSGPGGDPGNPARPVMVFRNLCRFRTGIEYSGKRTPRCSGRLASHPRYIQTLPKLGYRFIGLVDVVERPVSLIRDVSLQPGPGAASQLDDGESSATEEPEFVEAGRRSRRDEVSRAGAIGRGGYV